MRLRSLRTADGPRLFVGTSAGFVDLARATGDERHACLRGFLRCGEAGWAAARAVPPGDEGSGLAVAATITDPGKIFCLGRNYLEHVREVGRDPSAWPEVFMRGPTTITGPQDVITLPAASASFDYEGELGAVIGRAGRDIPAGRALEHVAGYVVLNDITARDWQHRGTQWTAGKNFDGTLPLGPELVTPDEVDAADVAIQTLRNGVLVQSARTRDMLFDLPTQIEFLSCFATLSPGDVVATGTPGGVGVAQAPPRFLADGDVVEVRVDGVGRIRNEIRRSAGAESVWSRLAAKRQESADGR